MATPNFNQVVVVPAQPEQVMAQLLMVAGADGYKPVAQSATGLTLHKRRIPVWAAVLAIFTFPFGLVFLLVRNKETVTIGLARVQGGTQVTIAGQASRTLQSALQYALSGYQPTAAGLPAGAVAQPPYGQQPAPPPPPPADLGGWAPPAPQAPPESGEAGSPGPDPGGAESAPSPPEPRPPGPPDEPPPAFRPPPAFQPPPAAPPGGAAPMTPPPPPPPAAPPGGPPGQSWSPPLPPSAPGQSPGGSPKED